jgi:hypothetical protein
MNLQYLSEKDWAKFQERYPLASLFLLRKSLEGEKLALTTELNSTYIAEERRVWIKSRLAELTRFDKK